MSDVHTWSTTAASNNSASPNGFPEAMAPSGVNDSARELMAAVARYRADTDGVNASTGSANAYVLAASRTMAAYAQGDRFCFEANFTNTGAATLNVDSLGAKNIKRLDGGGLASGDIVSGYFADVIYDGTQFILLNPQIASPALAYGVRASASAAMTGMSASTWTEISTFDTETFDSGGHFASSRFTPGVAGSYIAGAQVTLTGPSAAALADGSTVGIAVTVFDSGGTALNRVFTTIRSGAAGSVSQTIAGVLTISTLTNYIAAEAFCSTANSEVSAAASFFAWRIR